MWIGNQCNNVQLIENDCIKVDDGEIKIVDKFLDLGTLFHEETDQSIEIKTRIGKAKTVFTIMRNIITRKELDLSLQVRLIWCYAMSVLLYGMESWVLSYELEKRIEALEMFIYGRL